MNPFKKSAVVSTTWEVRESKRNKQRAKQDRIEGKRQGKAKDKEQEKIKKLQGVHYQQ